MKVINKPIEVIAVFDRKGGIRPFKGRTVNDDESFEVFTIDKVISSEKIKIAGKEIMKYTCYVITNGTKKICEIRFEIASMKWYIFKI